MEDAVQRLSHALEGRYRVERELGSGGSATVYLADDLRHERKVALKVLKPELAAIVGAERFLGEIRVTANLQHPNILPLFDSGEADGFLFYVMPYLAEESLRDRLDREKQLPVEEAVRIASEIADALHAAHDQGIVHRDIKPANVLLNRGHPLVADFGIALALDSAVGGRLTETGLSLGTPTYFSPEQASADRIPGPASDIYALGCVLFEMLAGRPPYEGSSAQAVLAKILTETPESVLPHRASVPPNVDAAIRRSLERTPADRFQTAEAFREALADPHFRHGASPEAGETRGVGLRSGVVATVAAVAVLAGVAIGRLMGMDAAGEEGPVTRYRLGLPLGTQAVQSAAPSVTVSRDGARIVYVGPAEDGAQLWVLERDQLRGRPIPGTVGAVQPFLSPDGALVGFIDGSSRALKVVDLEGSTPLTLVDSGVLLAAGSWGDDGHIYFDLRDRLGLARVRAAGGSPPETVHDVVLEENVLAHKAQDVLPGGRGVVLAVERNHENDLIVAMDTETGEFRVLVEGVMARYAASGHLIYVERDGSLLAAPFHPDRMEMTGPGVLVDELGAGFREFALSEGGRLVYSVSPTPVNEVVWVDRQGVETPVDAAQPLRGIRFLALSPDESRLAVNTHTDPPRDDGQIWIKELPRGPLTRLTFEGAVNFRPEWFPSGRDLAFISDRGENRDIWVARADGTGSQRLLQDDSLPIDEVRITRDGEWLAYRRGMESRQRDVYARALAAGQEESIPLIDTGFDEVAPALSPDGRWLAYSSNADGSWEVYVRPFPLASEQWRVSRIGGRGPVWAKDGTELFYRNGADSMVAVPVLPGSDFRFGEERGLFSTALYRTDVFHRSWDVASDGRFVMIRVAEAGQPHRELVVVENWLSELRDLPLH